MFVVTWTDDRIRDLKKWYAEGYSCAQIAGLLGNTTRNAVIGKVHRLGLASPNVSDAKWRKPKTSASRERKPRSRIVQANGNSNRLRIIESVESEPIKLRCAEVVPLNISLDDLHSATCHYPYGDTPPFAYCGHATLDGATYCDLHHELCHKPAHGAQGRDSQLSSAMTRHAMLPAVVTLAPVADWEAA